MGGKFKPRQKAPAARNMVVKDMILRGGGTPIAPNRRVKRATERAEIEQEMEDSGYDDDRYDPRSRGQKYNEY